MQSILHAFAKRKRPEEREVVTQLPYTIATKEVRALVNEGQVLNVIINRGKVKSEAIEKYNLEDLEKQVNEQLQDRQLKNIDIRLTDEGTFDITTNDDYRGMFRLLYSEVKRLTRETSELRSELFKIKQSRKNTQ
jgi:predicted RNA-binding protein (virulence factor B family)